MLRASHYTIPRFPHAPNFVKQAIFPSTLGAATASQPLASALAHNMPHCHLHISVAPLFKRVVHNPATYAYLRTAAEDCPVRGRLSPTLAVSLPYPSGAGSIAQSALQQLVISTAAKIWHARLRFQSTTSKRPQLSNSALRPQGCGSQAHGPRQKAASAQPALPCTCWPGCTYASQQLARSAACGPCPCIGPNWEWLLVAGKGATRMEQDWAAALVLVQEGGVLEVCYQAVLALDAGVAYVAHLLAVELFPPLGMEALK